VAQIEKIDDMKRVASFYVPVFIWLVCCIAGCTDTTVKKEGDIVNLISESQAVTVAWDAVREAFSEDIVCKYQIEGTRCSDGYWSVFFYEPNSDVLGSHFMITVYDDKTVKIFPGY
jgi:hypothetical protein